MPYRHRQPQGWVQDIIVCAAVVLILWIALLVMHP